MKRAKNGPKKVPTPEQHRFSDHPAIKRVKNGPKTAPKPGPKPHRYPKGFFDRPGMKRTKNRYSNQRLHSNDRSPKEQLVTDPEEIEWDLMVEDAVAHELRKKLDLNARG